MKDCVKPLAGILLLLILLSGSYGCAPYQVAVDKRSVGTIIDDKSVAVKIKYLLLEDEKVKGLDIAVYMFLGRVYLVGAVEDDISKARAVKIARAQKGVESVTTYFLDKSKITIGKTIDDTAITTQVKARLIGDKNILSTRIHVKTILGHVVLLGVVTGKNDVNLAIQHAKSVNNVIKIKSFLIIN